MLKYNFCTSDEKNYFRFFHIFLLFFYRLDIIRLDGQKYGLIDNFKTFKKMGLLQTEIQTLRRKKLFLTFPYFSLFFSTDLILSDRADKNID